MSEIEQKKKEKNRKISKFADGKPYTDKKSSADEKSAKTTDSKTAKKPSSDEKTTKKPNGKAELALIARKPLMLEASNEEAAAKRLAKKSTKPATAPKRARRVITETTSKVEKPIRPKPSAKTRVIPVTTVRKSKTSTDSNATTNKANKKDMKLPLLRKIHLKPSYIICGVLVLFLAIFFGRVALWENSYFDRMEGSDRDTPAANGTSGVIYDGGNEVDETEPTETEIANYVVAPNMPRYFSIPSLGIINARVAEVGLRPDGAVDTPNNAYMIGWYNGSVLPGEKGTALLDAHGGDLGNGIFRTLPRIQIGAEINIEMGDGRLFTYKVVDTATRPLDGANNADAYMPIALTSPQAGAASLTLITCTGEWSQVRQTYLDRFFARAVLQ